MVLAVPGLGVDRRRCAAGLDGGALATEEVMRRVERGNAFRAAYRDVAAALRRGESFEAPPASRVVARRRSTGGLGDLGLGEARARVRRARRWGERELHRFERAMARLGGRSAGRPGGRRKAR
jgi:hypothetical protein